MGPGADGEGGAALAAEGAEDDAKVDAKRTQMMVRRPPSSNTPSRPAPSQRGRAPLFVD
jgi:hypothetical protein